AIGRLWAIEWLARNAPIEAIVQEVSNPGLDPMEIRSRFYGIAELLADSGSDHDAAFIFESFVNEPDTNRQWLWALICLPKLISGNNGDDSLSPASHYIRREILAILANKFKERAISVENVPTTKARPLFPMAREA